MRQNGTVDLSSVFAPSILGTPSAPEPLNPPKNAEVPGSGGKERFRSRTDTEKERGYDAIRQTYAVKSNASTRDISKAFLDAAGDAVAVETIFDRSAEVSALVKSDIGNLITERLQKRIDDATTEDQRAEATANYLRFSERFAKRATELGQAVQVLDALDVFTRNGAITSATQQVKSRQDRMLGEEGIKTETEIIDAMNAENGKVVDDLIKDVKADVKKVKVTKKMVEKSTGGELPKGKKELDKAIKQAFDDVGLSIRDIIRSHATQVDAIGSNLVDKLTQQAGLSPAEAKTLSEAVNKRLADLTTDAKRKVLQKLSREKGGISRRVFTLIDKIVEMSNAGALDQPALRARIEELTIPADVLDTAIDALNLYLAKEYFDPELPEDVAEHLLVHRAIDWITAYKEKRNE